MCEASVASCSTGQVSLRRGLDRRLALSDGFPGNTHTPTSFVWEENDPFGGIDTARHLVDRMPDAELDLFAGAGHAPWLDDLDRATTSMIRFLQS